MTKIKQAKNKQWYFVVLAKNNKVLCTSETYKTKRSAEKGAKVLQSILQLPRKELSFKLKREDIQRTLKNLDYSGKRFI